MTAAIITGIWVLVMPFAVVEAYRWFYRDHRETHPSLKWDGFDRAFGAGLSLLAAPLWPLGVVVALAAVVLRRFETEEQVR